MIHQVRVIFGDTDQMGVVYYANFLRYFESSRAELLRRMGSSGRHLQQLGVGFPVVEVHCRYHRPAHYEDLLDIDVTVTELRGASLRFAYSVRRSSEAHPDGELLADGNTLHACANTAGRPRRIPAELRALLERALPG